MEPGFALLLVGIIVIGGIVLFALSNAGGSRSSGSDHRTARERAWSEGPITITDPGRGMTMARGGDGGGHGGHGGSDGGGGGGGGGRRRRRQ